MQMEKVVAVSVGTDHHPFDRLVTWAGEWAEKNPDIRVVIQRGSADPVSGVECPEVMPHDDLRSLFAEAVVVVCHGGPSTVMDARHAGSQPIVVPRNPKYGEHVDGHQLAFGEHLKRHSLATVLHDKDELFQAMDAGVADENLYRLEREGHALEGVVAFGKMLDELLGTTTKISDVRSEDEEPSDQGPEDLTSVPTQPIGEG